MTLSLWHGPVRALPEYLCLPTHANPLWGEVHAGEADGTLILNLRGLARGLPVVPWALAAPRFDPAWQPLFAGLARRLYAVSFMGLGLPLLALAYLHQVLGRRGID